MCKGYCNTLTWPKKLSPWKKGGELEEGNDNVFFVMRTLMERNEGKIKYDSVYSFPFYFEGSSGLIRNININI